MRQWKKSTEGLFYHKDTENTEFRIFKFSDSKLRDLCVFVAPQISP